MQKHTTQELSPARRQLLAKMQSINFGKIVDLEIRDGDPDFSSNHRILREIKLGAGHGPRPELGQQDFKLKAQVVELLECLNEMKTGIIRWIEVKDGLPFRIQVEVAGK